VHRGESEKSDKTMVSDEPPLILHVGRLSNTLPSDAGHVPKETLSSALSQRMIGRVSKEWRSPLIEDGYADALLEPHVGKLTGMEWVPTNVDLESTEDVRLNEESNEASDFVMSPALGNVLGIVSRSRSKFDSFQHPAGPAEVQVSTERGPKSETRRQLAPPGSDVGPMPLANSVVSSDDAGEHLFKSVAQKDMAAVIGLVSRLVGVFDGKQGSTASRDIEKRQIPLRGGGARRAKIDAVLALAASRTRNQNPSGSQAYISRLEDVKAAGLKKHEVALLENIFRSYDKAEGKYNGQIDMRHFSAAMSNPKIADLIRRVVNEEIGSETKVGIAPIITRSNEESAVNLSVEVLFDSDTIAHAAAVTLQALVRRVQTQAELRRLRNGHGMV